jgi:CRISPR-associated endonuclease/helicase Cas3
MSELTAGRFTDFFKALWGQNREPFAWQKALASRVIENSENPWPEVIALPTASGKTACLDIAVYALAAQTSSKSAPKHITAPRRIFFVVDRRLIVDEAFDRACKLADRLRVAENGILREVADSLRVFGGGDNPLACFQLRGGMYRSDAWAKSPTQPIIVASTVDQVGSRLLFRAYGQSSKACPIQAGLVGNDALILLDEAHCSVPFLETLRAVKKYRSWAEQPLGAIFHATIMSATPPEEIDDVFRDTSEEPRMREHPLGARQMADKPALLIKTTASGSKALEELAKRLAKMAEDLAKTNPVALVVFTNRVATARFAHRFLSTKHGDRAFLLTGRMRPLDRDDTVLERLKQLSADVSETRQLDAPVFVVATQTLEVGANLDFDVLVTECASFDALRQRFGRLNRMGRDIEAPAAILIRADQAESSEDDPVYGAALANTWKWLNEHVDNSRQINMGIAALGNQMPERDQLIQLNVFPKHAPVMLPAYLDCWVQTKPKPVPTPDVSVLLHGPGRSSADVRACWRADLDLDFPDQALDALAICPPAVGECLPVPIWFMRQWLTGEEPSVAEVADIEGITAKKDEIISKNSESLVRRVIQWRGRDKAEVLTDVQELRPGDVVVIPSQLEGWDVLGDFHRADGGLAVLDWGERAYAAARAKAVLRLHPAVIAQWPDFESKAVLLDIANKARTLFDEDPDALLVSLRGVLGQVAEHEDTPGWLKLIAGSLHRDQGIRRTMMLHPSGKGIVLRGTRPLPGPNEQTDSFSDEDDSSASGTVRVSLSSHLQGVGELARRFATDCGLPSELIEVISRAGLLHDPGKADPRFQALLHGGNPWVRGELLAKSATMPQGLSAYLRACKRTGYPVGGRHELLSVRLIESSPQLLPEDLNHQELLLHLVASHHGHCRPFAPVVIDETPVHVTLSLDECLLEAQSKTGLERLDSGVSERFWRLTRRYGWWGLAWLEAILRLADHRRSEAEELHRSNGDG